MRAEAAALHSTLVNERDQAMNADGLRNPPSHFFIDGAVLSGSIAFLNDRIGGGFNEAGEIALSSSSSL